MSGCGRFEAWVAGSDGGHQDGGVDGGRQDGGGGSGGGRQDGSPILVHPQEALHVAQACHCTVGSLSEDERIFFLQYMFFGSITDMMLWNLDSHFSCWWLFQFKTSSLVFHVLPL